MTFEPERFGQRRQDTPSAMMPVSRWPS